MAVMMVAVVEAEFFFGDIHFEVDIFGFFSVKGGLGIQMNRGNFFSNGMLP